jgi:PIN domain nuclease of toxin-antitoxin system
MQLLLDTHAFLWWVSDDDRLSRRARTAIADRTDRCYVSVASCWEIAIKISVKRLAITGPLERFLPEQLAANEFDLLPIEIDHVSRVSTLPFHHRDPFDRLLIAQSLSHDLAIVSADAIFRAYGVKRVW